MAFERLGDVIARVVSRVGIDGEGVSVAADPEACKFAKSPATEAAGEYTLPVQINDASRSIATAPQTRRPTSAVVIDLSVWKKARDRGHATCPAAAASRHF